MRITVSTFKWLPVPSEPAMRFACQNSRIDVLVAQLKAGYGVNAFVYQSNNGGGLTTPLIQAMAYPNLVRCLLLNGADINKPGSDGVTPLEHAVETLLRAQKLPVTEQNWKTDQQKQYLPSFIYTVLRKQCIRPKRPEIVGSPTMTKMTRLLARTRWARVQRLAKAVGIAAQVLCNHLQHVKFAPGSETQKQIRLNFESCVATQKGAPVQFEVDPTLEYFSE
jgi:hypothetical protein